MKLAYVAIQYTVKLPDPTHFIKEFQSSRKISI